MRNNRSLCEKTIVRFADNPYYMLKAYVDSKEGLDRAGGFAIQVCVPQTLPSRSRSQQRPTDTCFTPHYPTEFRVVARYSCDRSKATTTTWSASPCTLSVRTCMTSSNTTNWISSRIEQATASLVGRRAFMPCRDIRCIQMDQNTFSVQDIFRRDGVTSSSKSTVPNFEQSVVLWRITWR